MAARFHIPSVPAVMTGVLGAFLVVAGFGTAIRGFVHDRVAEQFVPAWEALLSMSLAADAPGEETLLLLARLSQVLIAGVEWIAGMSLLAAAFMPRRRLMLTNVGVGLAAGLFGVFLIAMFAVHDPGLPWWTQYPAILAWLGVTWLVVQQGTKG